MTKPAVPPRSRRARGKGRDLLRMLLFVPVWAIPFALFFGVIYGRTLQDYLSSYVISVVFAFSINLFIWAAEWFVRPVLIPPGSRSVPGEVVTRSLMFGGAATVGSFVAALALQLTIMPGILGSVRNVAVLGVYTVLFLGLVMGIVTAVHFYRDALERARSEQELTLARRIQSSFLPSRFPAMPGLEVHAVNLASRHVSGDFYDVVPASEGAHLLAIADVAGKGVPAALLSSMLQASLRTQAQDGTAVSEVMRKINALVYRSTAVGQFATFVLARVEAGSRRLSYSNAGHNVPVVFGRDGRRRMLDRGGTVVGILENTSWDEETVELQPGDRVVFYTDGISEAARGPGDLFGEDRLYETVERLPADLDARGVTQGILDAVTGFLDGAEPGDDMTVLVVRVLDGAS